MRHFVGAGVLATVADGATTWLAVHVAQAAGLTFVELNPVVALLMQTYGPATAMTIRVGIGLGLFGYLGWATGRSRWGAWPLVVATLLTSLIALWNVRTLVGAIS